MRLSQSFLPVLKETPKEAQIVSHRLMLRAGMIQQSSAGIYSWLPLGLPTIAVLLWDSFGIFYVSVYIAIAALLTLWSLSHLEETKGSTL